MNHTLSRFGILLSFTLAGALGACANSDTAARNVPINSCETDADCVRGSCDPVAHLCVAADGGTQAGFAVTPPTGAPLAAADQPITFAETPVSNALDHELVLVSPRAVAGRVEVLDATGQVTTIPASIEFRRLGALSSAAPVTAQAVRDPNASTDASYAYSARLEPGTYDVRVLPTDISSTPPYLASGVQITSGADVQTLTFHYPQRVEVSGTLVDATTHNPVTGVTVRIVDPAHPTVPVSTVRPTDATGAFSVWLAPGAPDQWALQISSIASDTEIVRTGRLVYQIARQAAGAVHGYSNLAILLPTMVGFEHDAMGGACTNCVSFYGSLEGQNPDGMVDAVTGATVDLRADGVLGELPPGHSAWFEAQVVSVADTATDGSSTAVFAARLLPGTYKMTITPPGSLPYAITQTSIVVTGPAPQRGAVFALDRLIPVTGALVDSVRLQRMAGIEVDAMPVGATLPDNELVAVTDRLARAAQTTTDAAGHFSLALDPGSYRIVVRPTLAMGYATQVDPRVLPVVGTLVSNSDSSPQPVDAGDVLLDPPILVGGVVRDPANAPVPAAVVRAFARVTNPVTQLYLDVDLGQVSANGDGAYRILLPSHVIQ